MKNLALIVVVVFLSLAATCQKSQERGFLIEDSEDIENTDATPGESNYDLDGEGTPMQVDDGIDPLDENGGVD